MKATPVRPYLVGFSQLLELLAPASAGDMPQIGRSCIDRAKCLSGRRSCCETRTTPIPSTSEIQMLIYDLGAAGSIIYEDLMPAC